MSGTVHPRPPRVRGHKARIRDVAMYGGGKQKQSVCSCGRCGPLRDSWALANNDARQHLASVWPVAV